MAEPVEALDFSIFDPAPGQDVLAPVAEDPAPKAEAAPLIDENAHGRHLVEEAEAQEEEAPEVEAKEEVDTPEVSPKKFAPADDDLITILQDGKPVEVRWGDHKGNVMRVADYTRKTTQVANREKEIEGVATQLAQREEALLGIVTSKEKLAKLYYEQFGEALAPQPKTERPQAQPSDDELVTRGDIQKSEEQILARAREEARQEHERLAAKQAELHQQQFVANLQTLTDQTIEAVIEDHKDALGHIPDVDVLIKRMAWREHQPKSPEAVQKALIAAGKALAEQLGVRQRETKKTEAVKKAALTKGIEPKGGTAPGRTAKTYSNGRDGWDELDKDVVSWVTSRGR